MLSGLVRVRDLDSSEWRGDARASRQRTIDTWFDPLYRFAFGLSGNDADALALTRQTFALWVESNAESAEASRLKCWLFSTLYRRFLNARRLESAPNELDEVPTSMPRRVAARIDPNTVMAALLELKVTARAPLTLFYLGQFSFREIAAIVDAPIDSVVAHVSEGKECLRVALRPESSGPQTQRLSSGTS